MYFNRIVLKQEQTDREADDQLEHIGGEADDQQGHDKLMQ